MEDVQNVRPVRPIFFKKKIKVVSDKISVKYDFVIQNILKC